MDAIPVDIIKLSLEKMDRKPARHVSGSSSRLHRNLMVSSLLNRALKTDSTGDSRLLMNYREPKLIDMCDVDDNDTLDRNSFGTTSRDLTISSPRNIILDSQGKCCGCDVTKDSPNSQKGLSNDLILSTSGLKDFKMQQQTEDSNMFSHNIEGEHSTVVSTTELKSSKCNGVDNLIPSNKRTRDEVTCIQLSPCIKKSRNEYVRTISDDSHSHKFVGGNVSSLTTLFQDGFGGLTESLGVNKIDSHPFDSNSLENSWSCNMTVLMAC